ncbi:hypothetical protein FRC02_004623 [Tulasnella sp. 418]|nr:hypothetical protein FRC02_004623 [Tulasnella sp. 418]
MDSSMPTLPPLPAIRESDSVYVFTHPGYLVTQKGLRKDDEVVQNYERLAFLGDTKLRDAITCYLYEKYPTYRVGAYAAQRSELESKFRLAKWADAYNLMGKLKCNEANGLTIRESVEVRAKVFQAYIGAVYLNEGDVAVKSWIGALIQPHINIEDDVVELLEEVTIEGDVPRKDIKTKKVTRPPSKASQGYLAKLNEEFQKTGQDGPKWLEKSDGPAHSRTWIMTAVLKGKEVAKGTGCKKQLAKEGAAKLLLDAIVVGKVVIAQVPSGDAKDTDKPSTRVQVK